MYRQCNHAYDIVLTGAAFSNQLKMHIYRLNMSYVRRTQRIIFEILLNQAEISLYLPSTDWFGTANRCPLGSYQ